MSCFSYIFPYSFSTAIPQEPEGFSGKEKIEIRQVKILNQVIEQDHRFVKKRTRPTLGFKNFNSAKATISAIENVRMIQKGQILGQERSHSAFLNFVNLMA